MLDENCLFNRIQNRIDAAKIRLLDKSLSDYEREKLNTNMRAWLEAVDYAECFCPKCDPNLPYPENET